MKPYRFEKLRPSRNALKAGDVFTFKLGDVFYFGRIICTDALVGRIPDGILTYIYSTPAKEKTSLPELRLDKLLIPPLVTEMRPWREGYFEVVGNIPLTPRDILAVHCFYDDSRSPAVYYDEYARVIPSRCEPCGRFSVTFLNGIEYQVMQALGLEGEEKVSDAGNSIEPPLLQLMEFEGSKGSSLIFHPPENLIAQLQSKGYQGGGYSWEAIIDALVDLEEGELKNRFDSDPEAEMYVAVADDSTVLERLQTLIERALSDEKLLRRGIERAEALGMME